MNAEELDNNLLILFRTIQFATPEELEEFQKKMLDKYHIGCYYGLFYDHVLGALKKVRQEMMK